jgi:hypothetical protein
MMGVSPVFAQGSTDVTWTWTAPTEGSPVVHYVVAVSINGGPFVNTATVSTNIYTLNVEYGNIVSIRVAGVDALDRQGPWSAESDPYGPDAGPPGQPGMPSILSIVVGAILLLLGIIGLVRRRQ